MQGFSVDQPEWGFIGAHSNWYSVIQIQMIGRAMLWLNSITEEKQTPQIDTRQMDKRINQDEIYSRLLTNAVYDTPLAIECIY